MNFERFIKSEREFGNLKKNWTMENEGIIRHLEINEWKNNVWDFICDLSCVCL